MPIKKSTKVFDTQTENVNHAKLLPCPFCGGNGAYTFFPKTNGCSSWAKVECQDCGGMTRVSQSEIEEVIRELVVSKWNMRYESEE